MNMRTIGSPTGLRQRIRRQEAQDARLRQVNGLLREIAKHGRRFFFHKGTVSQFTWDVHGRLWWKDAYSGKLVYPYGNRRWRGFTEGGTLRALVLELRMYIVHGIKLSQGTLGPWPVWYCEGDLWGYGDAMTSIRAYAQDAGMLPEKEE